ncbi:hypothetical protein AgCh_029226 [Apium graveolens]
MDMNKLQIRKWIGNVPQLPVGIDVVAAEIRLKVFGLFGFVTLFLNLFGCSGVVALDLFGYVAPSLGWQTPDLTSKMSEPKRSFESLREWVVDHKLRAVGCLWLSGITGSFAYNWTKPNMKTSVKIIHARLHAQALTLAALAGAAVVEYYDHRTKKKERVAEFLKIKDE